MQITYIKTSWSDRVVATPNDYTKTNETTGTVRLVPLPGAITNAGTTVTAARMNNIEQGIYDTQTKIQDLELMLWMGAF